MLGGVGVAGADVFVLQRLELLLGAEFVCLVDGFSICWGVEGAFEGRYTIVAQDWSSDAKIC